MCIKHKGKRFVLGKFNKSVLFISVLIIILCSISPAAFAKSEKKMKTDGERIVSFAEKYEGCSYVYGRRGPNAFDCSGFVYYIFQHFGVTLSASSSDYYYSPEEFGTVVKESEAKPGDIISWEGHVGIYIGDGKVIHALNPRKGVCVTDVSEFANRRRVSNPPHHYIRVDIRTEEEKAADEKEKKKRQFRKEKEEMLRDIAIETCISSAAVSVEATTCFDLSA